MKLTSKSAIFLATSLIIAGGFTAVYARGDGHGWRGAGHEGGFGRHIGKWMKKADADGDGAISLEEVQAMRASRFTKMDGNGDGVIDRAEIDARMNDRIAKRIERMKQRADRRALRMTRRLDKNRDGKITKAEFEARAVERFAINDLNDDGKISGDEMPRKGHRGSHKRGGHQRGSHN